MELQQIQRMCETTISGLLHEPAHFARVRAVKGNANLAYRLLVDDTEVGVCVDLRSRFRPAEIPQLILKHAAEGCDQPMLFTDYVTANCAEQLRDGNVWFADTLGNLFMEIPGKLLLYTIGQRPRRLPAPTGQHYSAPGAKVLHFLLKRGPNIQATYREIRKAVGVSIDKIGKLIRELEQKAVLQVHGSGQYEIGNADLLLNLWIDAYGAKLRPALLLDRCAAAAGRELDDLIQAASAMLDGQVVIGGEMAADQLTHHLRATQLRLYIPDNQVDDVRQQLRLAPTDSGMIELCKLYTEDIAGDQMYKEAALADAAFVYAELMTTDDDRLVETAMRLRQEHLAWTQ